MKTMEQTLILLLTLLLVGCGVADGGRVTARNFGMAIALPIFLFKPKYKL